MICIQRERYMQLLMGFVFLLMVYIRIVVLRARIYQLPELIATTTYAYSSSAGLFVVLSAIVRCTLLQDTLPIALDTESHCTISYFHIECLKYIEEQCMQNLEVSTCMQMMLTCTTFIEFQFSCSNFNVDISNSAHLNK